MLDTYLITVDIIHISDGLGREVLQFEVDLVGASVLSRVMLRELKIEVLLSWSGW